MDVRVMQFQQWLRQHRGVAECRISKHGRMVTRLLVRSDSIPRYTAALIRQSVLDEVRDTAVAHAKAMTTALRGYLRFLGSSGACRPELMHAVSTSRSGGWSPCRATCPRATSSGWSPPATPASRMASATEPSCSCCHVSGCVPAMCSNCGWAIFAGPTTPCGSAAKVGARSTCRCPKTLETRCWTTSAALGRTTAATSCSCARPRRIDALQAPRPSPPCQRPFRNQGGTFAARGWMVGPDVIPGRCSKPCRRPHVDADHPRAA